MRMRFALWLALVSAVCLAQTKAPRLNDAVKAGDVAAVKLLLAQHADLNATEPDGSTALHLAALRDNLAIADLLIAAHANVKAATRYNITPLSIACTNGN